MASAPPRLRSDLTIRQQETKGGPSFVLKDKVSGRFYRLREAEYFIARQFDGSTPLETIRQRAEAEFGASLDPGILENFVKTLAGAHLLDTGEAARKKPSAPRKRIQGNPLYFRVRVCDPDRLLGRLAPRLRFFYTPAFMAASAALIFAAVATIMANRTGLAEELVDQYRLEAIPVLLVVLFIVVSLHELAHGLTCKWFGGEVHEMGFMLIYFQPALYCDVSDAWLFPEKRKRLWVGFAGPYFELTLWALAALLWRLTDGETDLHHVALIVAGGVGLKTVLNFNPLLKFDGYYLLSDYLEVPNLRRRSFAHIGSYIKRLFLLRPHAPQDIPARDRRIYLAYGIVAFVFSMSALGYAFAKLGGLFIANGQPLVLLSASVVTGMKLGRRFRRLFRKPSAASSDDDDDDGDSDGDAGRDPDGEYEGDDSGSGDTAAVMEPDESSEEEARLWLRRMAWTAMAGAVLAVLFFGRMDLRVGGPVNVLPQENADVRSPLEEVIERIDVDEGDRVKAGDRIARLSDKALVAELGKTEADISEARANLRKLQAGPTQAEIQVARAAVSKLEDTLKYARSRLGKSRNLFHMELLSPKDLEDAEEQATTAQNDVAEAKSRLNVLLRGTRPEEIAATKAQIERLETQKKYLEEQMGWLNVLSPVTGIVATPSRDLKEMKHQLVKKGDLIAKVFDMTKVTAQIFVSERDVAGVQVGQDVRLKARAFPDRTFEGRVTSIATSAQGSSAPAAEGGRSTLSSATNATKTVIVTTLIDNPALLLKPEMTGQAKISCGRRRIVDLIARRLTLTFDVAFWSWW